MFCSNCGAQNVDTARFCEKCGTAVVAAAPPAPAPDTRIRGVDSTPAPVAPVATGKNPVLAVVLSIIPGVGQFYNGDIKKGVIMLIAAIVASGISAGVLWPLFVIWSMYDAYQVASGKAKIW